MGVILHPRRRTLVPEIFRLGFTGKGGLVTIRKGVRSVSSGPCGLMGPRAVS